jgi:hypothetical protein
LRSALFSADQMEQHGKDLAGAHRVAPSRADRLLARSPRTSACLAEVGRAADHRRSPRVAASRRRPNGCSTTSTWSTSRSAPPSGTCPRATAASCPRLAQGPSAGLPRVYDLAFEAISHGDGRVDAETLSRFVAAYQTVAPLELGELWAIPIMLRLALIENLRASARASPPARSTASAPTGGPSRCSRSPSAIPRA